MRFSARRTRVKAVMGAAAVVIMLVGLSVGIGARTAEAATQTLHAPWSLIGVTESGPVEEVFGGPNVDAVFAWDAEGEAIEAWQRSLPLGLNSLQAIADGQAVWVLTSAEDFFA